MAEERKGFSTRQKVGAGLAAGAFGFGLASMRPPDIPDPVKPEDFTAEERERLRGYAVSGDPMREGRERRAFNRLLTNSDTDVVGPSGAYTLAAREEMGEAAMGEMSNVYGQLDEREDEFRFRAETRLGELEAERGRDLDEYRQQVAAKEAAEETVRSNFKSGLLRSGLNLAGTLLSPVTGGASSVVAGIASDQIKDEPVDYDPNASIGFENTGGEAMGNYADTLLGDMDNMFSTPEVPDSPTDKFRFTFPEDPFDVRGPMRTGGNQFTTPGTFGLFS